jgi:nucleoside phosphorylase
MVSSALLARIAFDPGPQEMTAIPWPAGLAPTGAAAPSSTSLPAADVLVITWTAAEARTLGQVLTPGVASTSWTHYATDFAAYLPQLTSESPAKSEHRLASFCPVTIGSQRVICAKSELHPATDGPTLPTAQLAAQLATECGASLVITTGTAGGAGNGTLLGDVNVAARVHADFTTKLKGHSWSEEVFATQPLSAAQSARVAGTGPLIAANLGRFPAQSRPPEVWNGDTVSTDFFAFDTTDDHYGLRAYDPGIRAVEMDDAAICAGLAGHSAQVMSVRNASDPVESGTSLAAEKKSAEQVYQDYGWATTIGSAIVTWALIAGLEPEPSA